MVNRGIRMQSKLTVVTAEQDRKELLPNPAWLEDRVFYQIFPDRFYNGDPTNDPAPLTPWGRQPELFNFFGGDLAGIEKKIPYLNDLGINALYLNPIFDAPSNHKYDTRDYLRIAPEFGDLRVYLRLVKTLRQSGIRLLLDGVFNHTGDQFWAFRDLVRRGSASPYQKWYHCQLPIIQSPQPNYECWWGIGSLPKLNFYTPEVIRYILRVVAFWTLTGIDGWRLDVPNEVRADFWPVFRRLVKALNPEAYLVGEIWEDATAWLQGDKFDAVMNYPLRELIMAFFAKQEMEAAAFDRELANLRARYSEAVTRSMFNLLSSHDTPRFLTVCRGNDRRMLQALLFLFTYPGVPVLYYGDEIGMTGEKDPDCRRTMIWEETRWHREIYQATKALIRLRKTRMALRRGEFKTALTGGRGVYGYWRLYGQDRLLILFNGTERMAEVAIALPPEGRGYWRPLYPVVGKGLGFLDQFRLALPPGSGMIWEQIK
jgi:cyclomaltodextrinase